jgi:glutamyl-tRNA(Gln) amidotransferase subunit D
MYVYEAGREMMALGVVPLANMLPEVAFVKLSWVLSQSDDHDEVKRMMLTSIGDEITEREPYNGYLIYQGAVPEVQEFLKKIKR